MRLFNGLQEKKHAVVTGCVLGVILFMSMVLYVVLRRNAADAGISSYIRIMQDGVCVREIDLSKVEEAYEILLEDEDGGYNRIEVRPGSIGIIEANCPDGRCRKQGFIQKSGEVIVCLPHRLIIEFVDKPTGEELSVLEK